MTNTELLLLFGGILLVLFLFYRSKKAAAAKSNKGVITGVASAIVNPVHNLEKGVVNGVAAGIQHIPVAGKYIAAPIKGAQKVVDSVFGALGL
jgi:hypothetical protein